jgi:hypothetical protein
MEGLNIFERSLGILMFSWYFFASEITEIQKGKFTKTLVVTILSVLIAAHSDIQYFITNYPQRATIILFSGMIIFFVYAKYSNIQKKLKRKFNKFNKIILIYFHKLLDWIYSSKTDEYIEETEKRSLSFVMNNFRLLFLSILIFDHFILKFLNLSFLITFIAIMTLRSFLSFGKLITKHPLKIYIGAALLPWVLYFFMYFISKDVGIQPPFLEDKYLVSYLGLDTSDWLGSTIKFCIFSSASLVFVLIFWTIPSIFIRFMIESIFEFLRFFLVKLPVFYRQKRKAEIRQLNQKF